MSGSASSRGCQLQGDRTRANAHLHSFITSSANNVPRITGLMQRISQHFTSPLLTLSDPPPAISTDESLQFLPSETSYHLFPPPSALFEVANGSVRVASDLDEVLRGLGFGYRAGFIVHTISLLLNQRGGDRQVGTRETDVKAMSRVSGAIENFLVSLRLDPACLPGEERPDWHKELLKFKGVGRKVADCIGLMSLDRVSLVAAQVEFDTDDHPHSSMQFRSTPTSSRLRPGIPLSQASLRIRLPPRIPSMGLYRPS